jgi:hypothetical protein
VLSLVDYLYAGDINGDGKTDLFLSYTDHSGVGVLLNCS